MNSGRPIVVAGAGSIGQRAALVPTPGAEVYGLVFSPTRSELDRLYSESSVQAYKPQAVLSGAPGDI